MAEYANYTPFVFATMGRWSTEPGLTLEQRRARLSDPELVAFLRTWPLFPTGFELSTFICNRSERYGECEDADFIDLMVTYEIPQSRVHVVQVTSRDKTHGKYTHEHLESVETSEFVYTA